MALGGRGAVPFALFQPMENLDGSSWCYCSKTISLLLRTAGGGGWAQLGSAANVVLCKKEVKLGLIAGDNRKVLTTNTPKINTLNSNGCILISVQS